MAPGIPAITPHLNLENTDPNVPTFTTTDASAFALANPPFVLQHTGPLSVSSAQFMTEAEADKELNIKIEQIGQAPTALVCLVWLDGNFTWHGGMAGHPVVTHFSRAYMVFDARTGNILVMA
jgi:hypothetical protein